MEQTAKKTLDRLVVGLQKSLVEATKGGYGDVSNISDLSYQTSESHFCVFHRGRIGAHLETIGRINKCFDTKYEDNLKSLREYFRERPLEKPVEKKD